MSQQDAIENYLQFRESTDRLGVPLGRILIEDGVLSPKALLGAMAEAGRLSRPLAQVIAADALVPPEALLRAQAEHYGAMVLRRAAMTPNPDALALVPADICLAHGILPWIKLGDTLVVATARPESFDAARAAMPDLPEKLVMALTMEQDIHDTIAEHHGAALARAAETARSAEVSCRDMDSATPGAIAAGLLFAVGCAVALWVAPHWFFAAALTLALISLVVSQGIKLAALAALPRRPRPRPVEALPDAPPTVTLMVPLFQEEAIADALLHRLSRLRYPKSALEILLVLEAGDERTKAALARITLPPWVRSICVPPGRITTKPRALNYALNYACGTIIGILDAEDSPAPDQIDHVVARFARAPHDVACLQGILDFYNPRANWLSRCFAVEYAAWFRVLLPGLAKLGFVVPLGGTTVYIRREALAATGGWDAHNVTEDADLGILLARRGYVTELIPTVTREEANNRFWPWIRQRSRWLKGYAITWWVHNRRPAALMRDVGFWRFWGVQAVFLTTVLQFVLAPVLWSFWLIVFGLPHPLDAMLEPEVRSTLVATFLAAEAVTILIGAAALLRSPHRGLIPWVPTLFAYHPLGTLAIYRGLWEMLTRPFYWDKTQHGRSGPDTPDADTPPDEAV
ncbi:glycosyltransferase family 2 protein [Citreimonas salinaria]|uniref:Glycosyltransferase, catalytic subunit of cellulose synthase and poly-beta-1,6-N-acetylglucosamine synthase n=1 Tax=Citreimonas salinaria TaxID=321339 RepID=A0A1H3K1B9_9RHOB|nr:glycosyltransferase family 2 protein [Citreimonas salinaria]SDY45977.1 Glycosyltransferase, catalytic subunit of cellulose synthase and poly-beta-1,6-N-acetylglucosamine synthase [Citreimonas salinaria]